MSKQILAIVAFFVIAAIAVEAQTMSQSTDSTTITAGNSVACSTGNPTFFHAQNSWYRSYDVGAELIANQPGASSMDIVSITYGVETATAAGGAGSQSGEIRLYIDASPGTNPALQSTASLLLVHVEPITINDTTTGSVVLTQPLSNSVSFHGTQRLVVELFVPDGTVTGDVFFPGSNANGESAPTYISSSNCAGLGQPVTLASIGAGTMHIILDVDYLPSSFTSAGTFPASAEANVDLAMLSSVNGSLPTTGIGADVKAVVDGDVVTLDIFSPTGVFDNNEIAVVAQPFFTGTPPSPVAHPDVAVSLAGVQIVMGFTTSAFGPPLLPPGGLQLNFVVPPASLVPPGTSVMFQAVCPNTTGSASNGFFASSTAATFNR